uniref:Uncharacterized protein n=1 Tax=Candidatus Kentrum sp. FW TaxID=2126338 RepID=A0A450SK70_9GAMM|nr:MAG: hypothetical protein BECKFW1821B_GA0114236_101624 [Candidatus Kentron sp. FW]
MLCRHTAMGFPRQRVRARKSEPQSNLIRWKRLELLIMSVSRYTVHDHGGFTTQNNEKLMLIYNKYVT